MTEIKSEATSLKRQRHSRSTCLRTLPHLRGALSSPKSLYTFDANYKEDYPRLVSNPGEKRIFLFGPKLVPNRNTLKCSFN